MKNRAEEIADGMQVWFDETRKYSAAEIKAFNKAIFVAAEFVRRFDHYDETRSLAILKLLIKKPPEVKQTVKARVRTTIKEMIFTAFVEKDFTLGDVQEEYQRQEIERVPTYSAISNALALLKKQGVLTIVGKRRYKQNRGHQYVYKISENVINGK